MSVVLIGRPGCHLCDDARQVITGVLTGLGRDPGTELSELSIDDDEALRERYWEMIPVVLVDGRQHTYWRVDPARLRAALEGPASR